MGEHRRTAILAIAVTTVTYGALALALVLIDGPVDEDLLLTDEDGLVEDLGALGFLLASLLMLLALRQAVRSKDTGRFKLKALFLGAMALLFFLAAGEEISWGQRILGIATPEDLSRVNVQDEINLHNLEASGFDEYRLFQLFWMPYVLVLPFIADVWGPARAFLTEILPLPAWPLGLAYLANDLLAVGVTLVVGERAARGTLLDDARIEVREMLFGLLCALTAYAVYSSLRRRRTAAVSR